MTDAAITNGDPVEIVARVLAVVRDDDQISYTHEARRCVEALRSAGLLMEWRPIGEAKKQNETLLLLREGHGDVYDHRIFVGFWGDIYAGHEPDDKNNYRWCDMGRGLYENDVWAYHTDVTHFMPLPKPPEE